LVLGSGDLLLLNPDEWHSVQGIYYCRTVMIGTPFRGFISALHTNGDIDFWG
jgi:hypothetical protein